MKNLSHIVAPLLVLAGMLTGCMVRETPYAYGVPMATVQAGDGYPLYYADGSYWAYSHDSWYWWSNDRWIVSGYAPHHAIAVNSPHRVHGNTQITHGRGLHGSSHGASHGFSHGHGGRHGSHR